MIDRQIARGALPAAVEAAVAAGVDRVQVRDRELPDLALLEHVEQMRDAARRGAARRGGRVDLTVNRRVDMVLCADVEGVHLGFDAMDEESARALLGDDALVGRSIHAADEISPSESRALSYLHLAPIFEPRSKPGTRPPLGLAAVTAATGLGVPVIAQGGIDARRARAVRRAGASGVAVTGAILMQDDPAAAARALREALDG